ncbi:hypothetical protein GCM10027048_30490 [Hymenobacter coalescens]
MSSPLDQAARATDRPLVDLLHDNFQRAPFAKRIAESLTQRNNPDSIVVGLYGKWGEGKSTVLNFIRRALAEKPEKVAVLNFNPWRFPDETQLLLNFFGELAKVIDQNLLTKTQQAVKGFSTYIAPLIPSLPAGPVSVDVNKSIEALLKLAQPEVDAQRERIEKLIADSGKRVVVIIDDIDRLEKSQIQAVFRLIKLTADFKHTAYLLAFDDVMVARAIGEVFTSSSEDDTEGRALLAGQNFLEKIIQVPLRLPPARTDALMQFCFQRVDEALAEAGIEPTQEEAGRIGGGLRSAILPRLTTPRLAVRYANAITFSLPLLKGEVNTVDFLLTEAMHVFYPQLYRFVASREALFVGSTRNQSGYGLQGSERESKEEAIIDEVLEHYKSADERSAARALLSTLFPRINALNGRRRLFGTTNHTSRLTSEELTRHRHIAASTHFGRYFAYTVLTGDVSDQEFDSFMMLPYPSQLQTAQELIARLSMSTFLQKVSFRTHELSTEQATSLWQVISSLSPKMSAERAAGLIFLSRSEVTHASWVLLQLLAFVPKPDRFSILLGQVGSGGTFELAAALTEVLLTHRESVMTRLQNGDADAADELLTLREWDAAEHQLSEALLQRAFREADTEPLYKSHPEHANRLMHMYWQKSRTTVKLRDYVLPFLEANPNDVYALLEASSPHVSVNGGPLFRAGLTSSEVNLLAESVGDDLLNIARGLYGPEPIEQYPGSPRDSDAPTPQDRLRQFIYLFEQRNKPRPSAELVDE